MKWGLSDLRDAIREIAEERTERQVPAQTIEPDRGWSHRNQLAEDARLGAGPIFGSDTGSSFPPDTADGTGLEGALFRLRRTLGWETWEDYIRKRTVEDMRHSQDSWEELRQDWNREVEQAKQAGIHVIYRHRYQYLRGDLERMANDTHIGRDLSPAIHDALNQLRKAQASREHIEMYRDSIVEALAQRRGKLEAKAAGQGVAVSEHKDYRIWRAAIDEAVNIAEGIIANRGPITSISPELRPGERVSERRSQERARNCATMTGISQWPRCVSGRQSGPQFGRTATPIFSKSPRRTGNDSRRQ